MYNRLTSIQANYQAEIKTLDGLKEFIAEGRNKESRTIANNTTARLTVDGVAIRLHDTDIIIFRDGKNIELNSGGWRTVTTKERLNRYTNAGIYTRAGVWYLSDGSLFYDGMTIRQDGIAVKPKRPGAYEKKLKVIKKQAKQYAKEFVKALEAGEIPMPSGGDCWACLMRGPKGQEAFAGSGHIQSHIKDRYFVPSLLVNAGRDAGYEDFQIGMMGIGGQRLFINPEQNIYRYVVKQLQKEL